MIELIYYNDSLRRQKYFLFENPFNERKDATVGAIEPSFFHDKKKKRK